MRKLYDSVKVVIITLVLLGHGVEEGKMKYPLGQDAYKVLRSMAVLVHWRSYIEQGHWYRITDEIDVIVGFIQIGVS